MSVSTSQKEGFRQPEDVITKPIHDLRINKIDHNAPARWLNQGIEDFKIAGLNSLLYGLFFAIAGAITLWYTRDNPILVMAIISGFYLVGPPIAAGLYDMSQRIESGEPPSLLHAISVFGKNIRCLAGLSIILGVLMVAWLGAATSIVNVFFNHDLSINQLMMDKAIFPFSSLLMMGGILLALLASAVSLTFLPLLNNKQSGTITVLVILAFIMLAWVRLMVLAINTFMDNSVQLLQGWQSLINQPDFLSFLFVFLSVGLFFAVLAFSLSVIAVPLIIDRKVNVFTAISLSFKAVIKNPVPMFRWAATIAVLIAVGFGLFFIGLVITLPIIGHASWHAYRELITEN